MKGANVLKKTAPLLMMIPMYITVLLLVSSNNDLSDFTKGSVAGIFIGLTLATVLIIVLHLSGIQLKLSKFKKFKARIMRSK